MPLSLPLEQAIVDEGMQRVQAKHDDAPALKAGLRRGHNGRNQRMIGKQEQRVAGLQQAFHQEASVEGGNDDVILCCGKRAVHDHDVPVKNMCPLHRDALDLGAVGLRPVKAEQQVQVHEPARSEQDLSLCVLMERMNTAEHDAFDPEIVLAFDPDGRVDQAIRRGMTGVRQDGSGGQQKGDIVMNNQASDVDAAIHGSHDEIIVYRLERWGNDQYIVVADACAGERSARHSVTEGVVFGDAEQLLSVQALLTPFFPRGGKARCDHGGRREEIHGPLVVCSQARRDEAHLLLSFNNFT